MSNALIWLSGFSACGALKLFMESNPWCGFLVAAAFASFALAKQYESLAKDEERHASHD